MKRSFQIYGVGTAEEPRRRLFVSHRAALNYLQRSGFGAVEADSEGAGDWFEPKGKKATGPRQQLSELLVEGEEDCHG